jgi:predicted transport protein
MINKNEKYYFFEKSDKFYVIDQKNQKKLDPQINDILKKSHFTKIINTLGNMTGSGDYIVTISEKNNLKRIDDNYYYNNGDEIEKYDKINSFDKFDLSLSNDRLNPICIRFSEEHTLNIKLKEFKNILLYISDNSEDHSEYIKIKKDRNFICIFTKTLIKNSLKIFEPKNISMVRKYVKIPEIICYAMMENFNCDASIIFNYKYKTYIPNEFTYKKKLFGIKKFLDVKFIF